MTLRSFWDRFWDLFDDMTGGIAVLALTLGAALLMWLVLQPQPEPLDLGRCVLWVKDKKP